MRCRSVVCALGLLVLAAAGAAAADGERDGDRKIRDTIERAKEAEDRAKKPDEKPPRDDEEEGEEDRDGSLLGIIARALFEAFFQVLFESASTQRFAAYPYSPESEFFHNTSTLVLPDEGKWFSLQLASDAATHFDGTWGSSTRFVAQLTGLHLNACSMSIFSASEALSVLSVNAGITFFVPGFLLSGFAGAYSLDVLESPYLSFGFSCQLFLSARVHLDLFNVNAAIGGEVFSHWQATVELSLWRFSVGAGWHHNTLAGTVFSGPCLRVSLWL